MRAAARPVVSLLAGLALVLAFPPVGQWWVAPVAVAAVTGCLHGRGVRAGAGLMFAFGLGFFLPVLHWSGTYVGPVPWLLLAVAEAVFFAVLGAATALALRLPGWPVWAACLWVAQEAARDRLPFDGFPWARLAFGQAGSPIERFAAVGGAPLVTFVVALSGTLLAWAALAYVRTHRPRSAFVGALLGVVVASAGLLVPLGATNGHRVTVAVIQGNVPRLGLDFNAQREGVLRDHVRRTLELAAQVKAGTVARPELVIWPENSSDIDPLTNPDAYALIERAVHAVGVPVLVGTLMPAPHNKLDNVGLVWSPTTGPGARYVKRHPVPFGEYIPLRSIARRVSAKVDLVRQDFAAGDRPGVLTVGPTRVGDVICFEVAYDNLVRDVVTGGGRLIVVQTNNATFGHSAETYQQLAMARLRAVEHDRTVLVAATSGVSAVIDPHGRVVVRSKVFTPDILVESVPVSDRRTLATRLGAWPEWVLTGIGLLAAAVAVGVGRRSERTDQEVPRRPTPDRVAQEA